MRLTTLLSVATLAAVTALSGCGSSDKDGGSADLLSSAELKSALIALEDLGPGFKVDSSDDDDDDETAFGCLDGLDDLDKSDNDPERDADAEFVADSELGVPAVFNKVGTFKDADAAAAILEKFRKAVEGCTSVDATDKDGFTVKFDVTLDQEKSGSEATAQVNMTAAGTGSTSGLTFPMGIRMSAIQIDNHVALVGLVSMADDITKEADSVTDLGLARLAPIAAGDDAATPEPLNLHVVSTEELTGMAAS